MKRRPAARNAQVKVPLGFRGGDRAVDHRGLRSPVAFPASAMRMSPQAVQAVIEPAGFQLEQVVELSPYHYGAIFAAAR